MWMNQLSPWGGSNRLRKVERVLCLAVVPGDCQQIQGETRDGRDDPVPDHVIALSRTLAAVAGHLINFGLMRRRAAGSRDLRLLAVKLEKLRCRPILHPAVARTLTAPREQCNHRRHASVALHAHSL